MHYEKVEISGKKRLIEKPFLPGFVFAYMTRKRTHDFVKQPAKTASYLKYYTDKTKPIEPDTQLNPPITIPNGRMKSFINVVETKMLSKQRMSTSLLRRKIAAISRVVIISKLCVATSKVLSVRSSERQVSNALL